MARVLSELVDRVTAARGVGWGICEDARARIAAGEDVVMLGPGVPDLPPPPAALAACREALARGRTRYPAPGGEPALRAAVAARHARLTGVAVDPADVVITAGAQAGLLACALALAGPGRRVGIPVPAYPAHAAAVAAAGARVMPLPLGPAPGYALDLAAVRGADLALLLISAPHNPTGRVFGPGELTALAEACLAGDLWLVSDEVYAGLVHEGRHLPPAGLPGMACRTFTLGSLSKSHAMSGFRCGWVVAPPGLGPALRAVDACGSLGVPPFVQDAAIAALADGGAAEAEARAAYGARRHALLAGLARVPGIRVAAPEGGMFAMAEVSGTGLDGAEFARALLDRGVCVIPGGAFGPGAAGSVRIALSEPPERIRIACERMAGLARARSASVRGDALAWGSTKGSPCPAAVPPSS